MKQSKFIWSVGLSLVLLVVAGLALAQSSATADTYVNLNEPDTAYGTDSTLWATLTGDPGGACTVSRITYVKFDVSGAAGKTINSALLTLTRTGGTSNPNNYTVGLYEVADDSWTASSTWNTAPTLGSQIETRAFPAANGDTTEYSSAALVSYLQSEADGDGVASFAVQLVSAGGCAGATTVIYASSEATTGGPTLELLDPNAVDFYSFRAGNGGGMMAAAVGLLAVGLLAGSAVVLRARRS